MAVDQTVLFTIIPRGVTVTGDDLPVSVLVAPRLRGGDRLGQFPDWLRWTRQLQKRAPRLTVRCHGQSFDAPIDTGVLDPGLWEQLFKDDTFVRSHAYDDYTGHGIISYSVRETLSALKSIYQEAGVALALPERPGDARNREGSANRRVLQNLVDGLDVHWDGRLASRWRVVNRASHRSDSFAVASNTDASRPLDREGLIAGPRDTDRLRAAAQDFSVFHHMPTPDRDQHPLALDSDKVLDFHQVLSSLSAYPDLLRKLGLVFDFQLPRQFVVETPLNAPGTLSIRSIDIDWRTPTQIPALDTAYLHAVLGPWRLFVPAPRSSVLGLLALDAQAFGVAQVDVDGAMHKAIMLADSLRDPDPAGNLDSGVSPEPAPHPEVFDPGATLPSLRSGGFSLYADRRGAALFESLAQSKAFNQAMEAGSSQPRPFGAEDLVRGYRLDVWDADSGLWHSLHRRRGEYTIGDRSFRIEDEEGFVQMAATQPAPGATPADKDLYLHEAFARWAGWSLGAPRPSRALSRFADPQKAIPKDNDPEYATDAPVTPFKMSVNYQPVAGSLPALRFGRRYRFRARAVDLAGNSLVLGDAFGDAISRLWALPQDPEGSAYLRYEPVAAPLIVLRDADAVTDPGSALDRMVIRSWNDAIEKDGQPADTHAAERHLVPPRTGVEIGERHGMFDDAAGKLKSDAATWALIGARDAGELPAAEIVVAGKEDSYPIVTAAHLEPLPYLPDPFSRGVAIRDLPGAPQASVARIALDAAAGPVTYAVLDDPNPRPGSATLIPFGDTTDWTSLRGIRLALAEPTASSSQLPTWDPDERVLTVFLAKGQLQVIPISSYVGVDDLKQMGVWQWLREYVEQLAVTSPQPDPLDPGTAVDRMAHVLQRAVEGGHWMLTPPHLVTQVHAVQQPIGTPAFAALQVNHQTSPYTVELQTAPIASRADPTELAPITAWRMPGATDAYLHGALKIHGASTQQVSLLCSWDDPLDDPADSAPKMTHHASPVDEIQLAGTDEGYLGTSGADGRLAGYYDPEHDQMVFVRAGDFTGDPNRPAEQFSDAMPRHQIGDVKHHRISYTAVAASRYREYFPQGQDLDFTRRSAPVIVDVPASARPLAPDIAFVLPTFGWQRQGDTNLQRSVRFGGGLRVYLQRPWYSSGDDELLGVTLWNSAFGNLELDQMRVRFKPYITQWGMDPIWDTGALAGWPAIDDFAGDNRFDRAVSLEEQVRGPGDATGRVDVVGFPATYDPERQLWYADLTLNLPSDTYMPFVRLALARYQPHALPDAKISRVVLADFAQLTPTRAALVTTDPHHARTVRVVVSGMAPRGPDAVTHGIRHHKPATSRPTRIQVRLQERNPAIASDLGWQDAAASAAVVHAEFDGMPAAHPDVALWAGTVTFAQVPEPGRYRLVIEESEFISSNHAATGRLVYAEIVPLNADLLHE
ncbi:MAG: hypothetical protein ACREPQ_12585 [Rhodanobacter sp.]